MYTDPLSRYSSEDLNAGQCIVASMCSKYWMHGASCKYTCIMAEDIRWKQRLSNYRKAILSSYWPLFAAFLKVMNEKKGKE
jgi:hypothetical protein